MRLYTDRHDSPLNKTCLRDKKEGLTYPEWGRSTKFSEANFFLLFCMLGQEIVKLFNNKLLDKTLLPKTFNTET